jgi:HSP20 family protein
MKEPTADIFTDFERIRERMEQAWRQVLGPPGSLRFCPPLIEPAVDVYETEREVVVVMEMAGILEGEVEIVVDGRKMVISGERRPSARRPGRIYSQMEICHGPFRRELLLPAAVAPDKARVEYSRGMLEIALPKVRRRAGRPVKIVIR